LFGEEVSRDAIAPAASSAARALWDEPEDRRDDCPFDGLETR
jgi:hypothetical protein